MFSTNSITRQLFQFISFIAILFSASVASAQATTPTCPLEPTANRHIIEFSGDGVRSDIDIDDARLSTVLQNIDAGIYDVTFVSYDAYASRAEDEQRDERWSVVLSNGDEIVAQTNATTDLPDGVDETMVTETISNFSLAGDITAVVPLHAAYPSNAVNGVVPVCVAFDPVVPAASADEVSSTVVEQTEPEEDSSAVTVAPIVETISNEFTYPTDAAGRCSFVSETLGQDSVNARSEVINLKSFLQVFEGETLTINGTYDNETVAAVKRFQEKYADDVLSPWNINEGTGYTGVTTKHKINEIFCGETLPYTESEMSTIATLKGSILSQADVDEVPEDIVAEAPQDVIEEETTPAVEVATNETPDEVVATPTTPTITVVEEVTEDKTLTSEEISDLANMSLTEGMETENDDVTTGEDSEDVIKDKIVTDIADEEEKKSDEESEVVITGTGGSDTAAGVPGIEQTAAVIVGFVDQFSLPILIVLVLLLAIQIYVLWKAPKSKAF